MIRKLIARLAAYFAGQPSPKPKFVVWYQDPRTEIYPRAYLAKGYKGVKYYNKNIASAIRFDTLQEAMLAKPVYDGSFYIGLRSGVIEVYD